MIFNFVYLDKPTLAGYAAQVDGGLIAETMTRSASSRSAEAGFGFKWINAKIGGKSDGEQHLKLSDAPEAQFQRLIAAGNVDPDALAWNDILEPASQFKAVQVGEMIKWECNVDIPYASRLIAKGGAGSQMLDMIGMVIDAAAQNMPAIATAATSVDATVAELRMKAALAKQLVEGANVGLSVIGSDPDTDWKVFGEIRKEHLTAADIDTERLIIVGKVKRILGLDDSYPLVSVAGLKTMVESLGVPKSSGATDTPANATESSKSMQVYGPALELDILAICR